MLLRTSFIFLLYLFISCHYPIEILDNGVYEQLAFPGAEGYGKYTTGGRGGKIVWVKNLNDDGDGSLRVALKSNDPKIILFSISGTMRLKSPLRIYSNTTIAGHSAPGGGICIADQPVILNGNNIIVRYIRIRMGDRFQNKGKVHGSGHDDALSGVKRTHIIIDHCSLSWSTDEVMSIYLGDSTTLQWNLISEPLNYSYHFEEGDQDWEQHGFGGIWGGKHLTAHHNLFAHCINRTPRFNGIRSDVPTEIVDYRNNLIYNWKSNNVYGGEGGMYNIINNYYKPGPATNKNAQYKIANPYKSQSIPYGKWYIAGNMVEGHANVSDNNKLGISINDTTDMNIDSVLIAAPHRAIKFETEQAIDAYNKILISVGASHIRDTLDMRLINDVKHKTGRILDVQGGYPHGTAFDKTMEAWPKLESGSMPKDTDQDGMPDQWEKKYKLNRYDATDAIKSTVRTNYTNIEVYLQYILDIKKPVGNKE